MIAKRKGKNLKNDKLCQNKKKKNAMLEKTPGFECFDSNLTLLQCAILCDGPVA